MNSIVACELLLGKDNLRQLLNGSFSAYVYKSAYNRLSGSKGLDCTLEIYLYSRNSFW